MSLLPNKAITQSTCNCNGHCDFNLDLILMCDQFQDSQGPYFVKVYLWFVVPPNAPGAFSNESLPSRAGIIWNNLSAAYTAHNIFFVPGFGSCVPSLTYDTISSNILPGSGIGLETLRNSGYKNTDGIDVYIFRDDVSFEGDGNAFCIPSDRLYLVGAQDGAILSKSHTVSHEIGHCLGLNHPGGTSPNFCVDNGSDCQHTGDLVCDTPPDDQNYHFNGTSCTPTLPLPTMDYLNYMSLFKPHTCRDHFTPGQGQRMRRYLHDEIGPLAHVKIQDIVISNVTIWSTPMNVSSNIIIEPGGRLDIHAPVTMTQNAHIYVKTSTTAQAGGQLNIYSLITASCDKMWEGIIVDGRQSQFQPTQSQGRVAVYNGGIIEHAICGIRAQGRDSGSGAWQAFATGGIVTTYQGVFRNNLVDIHLPPYFPANKGYIYLTQFTTTDAFRDVVPTIPKHVFLDGVSNVKIFGCSFSDARTANYTLPSSRYSGIVANNSGFHVRPLGANPSTFTGLFEGVHVSQISELSGNSVSSSQFNGCFTGIFSNDNNNYTFEANTFSLQRPIHYTGPLNTKFTSIYMEGGTTAFAVRGNYFANTSGDYDDIFIGTDALSITKDDRSIASNTYFNLHKGNIAKGLNGFTMGEMLFGGLMYECNSYEQNLEHDNIVESGIVRKEQGPRDLGTPGFPRLSTGNIYIDVFDQQFTNLGSQIIDYHHRPGTLEELLDNHFSGPVIPKISNPNTGCDSGGSGLCPNPPCPEAKLALIKTQFLQNKQQWSTKTSAFPAITNPALRISEADAINSLRHELDRDGNSILLHYALDTAEVNRDSILTWMGQFQTYNADLQLAVYQFFTGNYGISDNLLQSISTQYQLSGDLVSEFNDIIAIIQTVRPHLLAGGKINALASVTINTLESEWGVECSSAGALARDILHQNERRLYATCYGTGFRPNELSQTHANVKASNSLNAFPNPVSNTLTIERANTSGDFLLRVTNLSTGQVCIKRFFYAEEASIDLNVSALSSGVYLLSYENAGVSGKVRVVISH